MEYFYDDALRWGFGFDNPNKAAVLFACGLPLCWMLWQLAWRLWPMWLRVPAVLGAAALVLGDGFLLFKTYSRGGAVAAAVALAYMVARGLWNAKRRTAVPQTRDPDHQAGGWLRGAAGVLLVLALGGLFWWTGLAERSAQPLDGGDASVENRLVLWRSALQMAVENPLGFGAGHSGEAYMNWYQPLEMTAGYRTMVNSYLTALVEWGWPLFAFAVLAVAFFWGWANPGRERPAGWIVAGGARGVLVAFAVAGIFSTTMEESVLWIAPVLAALALGIWAVLERRGLVNGVPMLGAGAVLCGVLFLGGWGMSAKDGLRKEFPRMAGAERVILQQPGAKSGTWIVQGDPEVLGQVSGKLLRQLATSWDARLDVGGTPKGDARVILCGEATRNPMPDRVAELVLLAPASMESADAERLLSAARKVRLFVPDIDEDGRTAFWMEEAATHKNVELVTVAGVGRQLDWGWDQVIEKLTASSGGRE